jgi:hypothetical protein
MRRTNDEKPADAELPTVLNKLVLCDSGSVTPDGCWSQIANHLDSITKICLLQLREVYAVACAIPLKNHSAGAPALPAKKPLTLIVAESHGVAPATRKLRHDVLWAL